MSNMDWPFRPAPWNGVARATDGGSRVDGSAAMSITQAMSAGPLAGRTSWTGSGREGLLWRGLVHRYRQQHTGDAAPTPVRKD